MRASVIIAVYNRENIIGYCLESLSKQELSDFEVIIVDNESTDNTQDVIRKYSDKIDIKILNYPRSEFNLSKVRNFGIKHAMNELIIIIDSDIIVCNDFIAQHIAIHKRNNNNIVIGYCFANNHFYDKDIFFSRFSDSNSLFSDKIFLNKSKDMREYYFNLPQNKIDKLKAPWSLFWTGNVSFLKESFNTVGGFNEIYTSWGMEDVDLGYKFFKHKLRFVFSSKAKGVHYPHERDNAMKFTSNTNNKYLFYENYKTIETELYIIANVLSFNNFLYECLGKMKKSYYNNPLSQDIEYTTNNEKKILFGANKELISIYKPDYIIEPNLQDYTKCKNLYSIPIECSIGIRTTFHDKIFKIAIIYKTWKKGIILDSIVKEAKRISENIMILE